MNVLFQFEKLKGTKLFMGMLILIVQIYGYIDKHFDVDIYSLFNKDHGRNRNLQKIIYINCLILAINHIEFVKMMFKSVILAS